MNVSVGQHDAREQHGQLELAPGSRVYSRGEQPDQRLGEDDAEHDQQRR